MKDSRNGVVWGSESKAIESDYIGCPPDRSLISDKTPLNRSPQHVLMLPPNPASSAAPKRMILSDYYYLQAAQYKFVLVKRRTKSPSPSPSQPELAVALRCQHCDYTKTLESIRDCSSSCSYLLNSHLRTCCDEQDAKRLNELKDSRHKQEKLSAISMSKYVKHIMMDVYGMTDLGWNGVSGGVGFSDKNVKRVLNRLVDKYGGSRHLRAKEGHPGGDIGNKPWESFALPLLLDYEVDPFTAGLVTEHKGREEEGSRAKSETGGSIGV